MPRRICDAIQAWHLQAGKLQLCHTDSDKNRGIASGVEMRADESVNESAHIKSAQISLCVLTGAFTGLYF